MLKQVRKEVLFPYQEPEWNQSQKFRSTLGPIEKLLSRLYDGDKLENIHPVRPLFLFGALFFVPMEAIYPGLIAKVLIILFPVLLTDRRGVALGSLFILFLLFFFLPLVMAIGAYWALYKFMKNTEIKIFLRLILFLSAAASIGAWGVYGGSIFSSYIPSVWSDENIQVQSTATYIQQSLAYWIFVALLFYLPAILYVTIWLFQLLVSLFIGVKLVWHWHQNFYARESIDTVVKFIFSPLQTSENEQRSLIQFEQELIKTVRDWALQRKAGMESRLLPISLSFAFLAIIASTSLGERVVQMYLGAIADYFYTEQPSDIQWMINFYRFIALILIVMYPTTLVFLKVNEIYGMEFIAEACLLAQSAKSSIHENEEKEHRSKAGEKSSIFAYVFKRLLRD